MTHRTTIDSKVKLKFKHLQNYTQFNLFQTTEGKVQEQLTSCILKDNLSFHFQPHTLGSDWKELLLLKRWIRLFIFKIYHFNF